jgi:hypothetical protein
VEQFPAHALQARLPSSSPGAHTRVKKVFTLSRSLLLLKSVLIVGRKPESSRKPTGATQLMKQRKGFLVNSEGWLVNIRVVLLSVVSGGRLPIAVAEAGILWVR